LLEIRDVRASYGAAEVVRGVSLQVEPGRVVAVVGPDGAGKTTLARTVAALHRARRGRIRLDALDLSGASAVEVARAGIALVPQGRRVFASLTVAEHLAVAGRHSRPGALSRDELLELFPNLARRLNVRARALSGGEQQMLAIGRAVLLGPAALIMDEPTEGLAPAVVDLVARLVDRLRERGVAVLLFEQVGGFPFHVADDVLAIDRGAVVGPAVRPEVTR
jgi:branched-chain amino acid transport system ATP-binding protein